MFNRGRRPKITSYRTYLSGDASAVDVPRYEVFKPARAPSFESDVLVPFVQGLIIGVLGGGCLALAGVLALDVAPVKTLAVIPVCIFLAVMWRIGAIHESLWRIESVSRLDLDGDGMVGAPDPERIHHFVSVAQDLPEVSAHGVDLRDLAHFVEHAGTAHRGTGQKAWRGQPMPSGKTCGDTYHTAILNDLRDAGIWRDGLKNQPGCFSVPREVVARKLNLTAHLSD